MDDGIANRSRGETTQYALGIDVGYSKRRRSTGLCLLEVAPSSIRWRCVNTGTDESQRLKDICDLVPRGTRLLGVGIDGPLTPGLQIVPHYRSSDALLTRGVFAKRGKPGATSAPSGQHLHCHATLLAKLILRLEDEGCFSLAASTHPNPVHPSRILEVFPNAFLSVLLADVDFCNRPLHRNASDVFWEVAVREEPYLESLFKALAPCREFETPLKSITDHDHRAALLCALAVLCAAQDQYVLSR